ncbi:hypothetical protein ABK040_016264 [Willaertia magna]
MSLSWLVSSSVGSKVCFEGIGEGFYPTIQSFKFKERLIFSRMKPGLIQYEQKTFKLPEEIPMHAEVGFFRIIPPSNTSTTLEEKSSNHNKPSIEFICSHPNGLVEIDVGKEEEEENKLILDSFALNRSPTSKPPYTTAIRRVFEMKNVDKEEGKQEMVLLVNTYMSTSTHTELTHHLTSELKRIDF